jgi:diguanylate cyclase (GGDEF)-like protein
MDHPAYLQIVALLTRIQNYPGLSGLDYILDRVEIICCQNDYQLCEQADSFVKGFTCDRNDQLEQAILFYQRCIEVSPARKNALRFQAHILLASIYADREQYREAYALYQEVLLHTHLLDTNALSLLYTNVSDLYLSLEKYHQAVDLAKLGAQASEKVCNQVNQAICQLNIGLGLGKIQQIDKALVSIERALSIALEIKEQRIEAISHGYLAQTKIHSEEFSFDDVEQHFITAHKLFAQVKDKHNQQENLTSHLDFLVQHLKFEQAQVLCNQLAQDEELKNNFGFYSKYCRAQIAIYQYGHNWQELAKFQSMFIAHLENQLDDNKQNDAEQLRGQIAHLTQDQAHLVMKNIQEQIGTLTDIGQSIATSNDLEKGLAFIYQKVGLVFPTDEFGIALYNQDTHELDYRYFFDSDGLVERLVINCDQDKNIGSYVVRKAQTVHINNVNDESISSFVPLNDRKDHDLVVFNNDKIARSVILTPIKLGERILGVLSIQHHEPEQYQQHHVYLFEQLASFIAISLENFEQRQNLQQANLLLETLSRTEPLTGLYNRYQLDSMTPSLISNAQVNNHALALVIIDIDYYKGYNDFHGHHKGDLALKLVSSVLKSVFEQFDTHIFRYGGDEFLIICENLNEAQLMSKLSLLQEQIEDLHLSNPLSQCAEILTLSVGAVNFYSLDSCCFEELFTIADKQLYRAKEKGRNAVCFATHSFSLESV